MEASDVFFDVMRHQRLYSSLDGIVQDSTQPKLPLERNGVEGVRTVLNTGVDRADTAQLTEKNLDIPALECALRCAAQSPPRLLRGEAPRKRGPGGS